MSTQITSPGAARRRKIHYVDRAIQSRLLVALILLEVLLVGAGLVLLYVDLKAVVEDNMFRIHLADAEPIFTLLFRETMRLLAILVVVNLVMLAVVERLWGRYVNSILRPFSGLVARTGELDLSGDAGVEQRHEAVGLALAWREAERTRCKSIRAEIADLRPEADFSSPDVREQARASLERLKALLPPASPEKS